MTDTALAPAVAPVAARRRRPWIRWALAAVAAAAALAATFTLAWVTASTVAPVRAGAAATADEPWFDAEFDFLGAVATWPVTPEAKKDDPFRGVSDGTLLAGAGTVCTRAGDRGMDAAGMGDLLRTDPHQTYVLVTEAIDKLCPSQTRHLADLRG